MRGICTLRDPALLGLTTVCFVAFCLAASGGYLVNDLVDLRDDRAHAAKRQRPLASGAISVRCGVLLAATLLASALALACALSTEMLLCIAGYMLASQTYTFWAKRKLALDILFLVGLYISRIIAGVLVAGAEPSFWLLAFSMFVFFSLACLKRFVEISSRDGEELEAFSARAYRSSDTLTVAVLGMARCLVGS